MPDNIVKTIETDLKCDWLGLLSSTEAALLHVARSLIANPEILCIHKPALYLNERLGDNMYTQLKDFVQHRGLCLDKSTFYARRPRTCILSARRVAGTAQKVSDAVFYVSKA